MVKKVRHTLTGQTVYTSTIWLLFSQLTKPSCVFKENKLKREIQTENLRTGWKVNKKNSISNTLQVAFYCNQPANLSLYFHCISKTLWKQPVSGIKVFSSKLKILVKLSACKATNLITASVWDKVGLKMHFKWNENKFSQKHFSSQSKTFSNCHTWTRNDPKPCRVSVRRVIHIYIQRVTKLSEQGACWDWRVDGGTVPCLCVIIIGCEGRRVS